MPFIAVLPLAIFFPAISRADSSIFLTPSRDSSVPRFAHGEIDEKIKFFWPSLVRNNVETAHSALGQ